MTTTIPNPPANPMPYTSTFESDMTAWLTWITDNASKFGDVASEVNDAFNTALLSVTSTSTSSITIASTGTINITVEADRGYAIGMTVKIASVANPVNYVKGTITAYNKTTGATSVVLFNKGGAGTFADWSVFFDIVDPTILSVPTGESVAAGALLGVDDAGNSMSVDSISTAVLQAVTATSLYSCSLSGGNTAVFWTAGSTDLRMMIVDQTGATVLASTSIGTGLSNTQIWTAQLTNGNIAVTYSAITTQYPTFKVINTSGGDVVAATTIEAAAVASDVKVCALTGGGFATVHCGASASKYAVYTNAGGVTAALATLTASAHNKVSICPMSSGGFSAFSGTGSSLTGNRYTSAGALSGAIGLTVNPFGVVGTASTSGSVVAASGGNTTIFSPAIHLASDSSASPVNTIDNTIQNSCLLTAFNESLSPNTYLRSTSLTVLGDGTYLALFAPYSTSNEYPRYVNFKGDGTIIRSGIVATEALYGGVSYAMYAMPHGTNGFTLVWAASNRNIKFARVKSGYVVGVSLGAVGATHQYLVNGSVTLANANMLNAGGSKVNYKQQGAKVVI